MRVVVATILAVLVLGTHAGPATASTSGDPAAAPPATAPVDTTTPPDTSSPSDTSAPSGVDTTSRLVGVDSVGGADATTATWLAVVGALVLVGVAVWWMLRSTSRDDHPPSPPADDWPTDSEVI